MSNKPLCKNYPNLRCLGSCIDFDCTRPTINEFLEHLVETDVVKRHEEYMKRWNMRPEFRAALYRK